MSVRVMLVAQLNPMVGNVRRLAVAERAQPDKQPVCFTR